LSHSKRRLSICGTDRDSNLFTTKFAFPVTLKPISTKLIVPPTEQFEKLHWRDSLHKLS